MCGGCGDDSCGYFVANILYVSERLASCCAATAVVVCLVVTLLIMLGLGVGLGYNYCVIDTKLLPMPKDVVEDEVSTTTPAPGAGARRRKRASAPAAPAPAHHTPGTRETTRLHLDLTPVTRTDMKPTLAVPLRTYRFQSFLHKLTKNNRNVTSELIQ